MKLKHYILITAITGMASLSGNAAMIIDADDYEHDTVGAVPFKATLINPSSPGANAAVDVVDGASNQAGTGSAVRLLDDDNGTAVQLEYDFTIIEDTPRTSTLDHHARLSAVRVDFSFAPLSTTGTRSDYYSITLGEHLTSQSSSSTHFLDCRLYDEGTIDFTSTAGPDSTGHAVLSANNTLSIFVNDHQSQINYTGPDQSSYSLPANAVAYWLNGNRISFGGQGYTLMENSSTVNGTINNSTNNLGRFAIVSTAGDNGLDYVIDDIMIYDLDSEQDPVGTSWLVSEGPGGLEYTGYANEGQGNAVNTVPDFSGAGYKGGGVPIPFVPAAITLTPSGGDDKAQIQDAIDQVSLLPIGPDGFRGAVVLEAGEYEVSSTVTISTGGVVIRGAGSQENGGTRITYTSTAQSDLFVVSGAGEPAEVGGTRQTITDSFVPVGAMSFNIASAAGYAPGDEIIIQILANQQWIDDLAMNGEGWTPAYYSNRKYRCIVTAVNGNTITVDKPVLQTIEDQYGGGEVYKYTYAGSLQNVGFEALRLESSYAHPTDENHGWDAIKLLNLENGWVRQVTARYFIHACVYANDWSRRITVEDCSMLDAVCTTSSGRRYSFSLDEADSVLFQRCLTRHGRHDFASGSLVQGPNVWVDCRASETANDIGPHHRYSTGQLYDNIFGGEMNVQNREGSGSGHGWSGAQIMFWNCDASSHYCDAPAGAMNWVVGSSAAKLESDRTPAEPFGIWDSLNQAVTPRSLYYAQLADRLGDNALNNVILPQQKAGNVWEELLLWDGDGLFGDDAVAWSDEENGAYAGYPVVIHGAVRNLVMLDRGVTYSWAKVSGPGTVNFGDNTSLKTTATCSAAGTYVLELTVDDGVLPSVASVTVDVNSGGPETDPPAAPSGLSAITGTGTVFLDWDDNLELDLASYSVYRSTTSGSGYTEIISGLSSSDYTDNTVINGTTYYYVVSALDINANESAQSAEVSASPVVDNTPPAVPANLIATAGDGYVSLDWDDNTEPDFSGHIVYRTTTPGSGYAAITNGLTYSEYVDHSALNGVTYYYAVAAVDITGNESAKTTDAQATPSGPTANTSVVFGSNNDGTGGFTTSPAGAGETWSTQPDSVNYTFTDITTYISSLLRSFSLNRTDGSYTIEGVLDFTDGYGDDNNRIGMLLFNDTASQTVDGGGLYVQLHLDPGSIGIVDGINGTSLASATPSGAFSGDSWVGTTLKYTVDISFANDNIDVAFTFTDQNGVEDTVNAQVPAANYPGEYFGFAPKIRNRGDPVSNRDVPPILDYRSFDIIDHSPPPNQPPAFFADPFVEANAMEGSAYSSSIADNASDPESDPMTFSKVSGPAWLSVAANGDLSGTPGAGDVGENSWTVQVNATGGSDTATLEITIDAIANQPPAFTSDPIVEANAMEGSAYSSSIADNASDPESDPMTFSKVSGPAWLSVAANGDLSGTPGAGDVGLNSFTVQVNATGGSDTATLEITIDAIANQPPAFTSDPVVEANATEGSAYSSSIADNASDPESDPMTFSKVSGPAWLSVAANGDLTGTPLNADVGPNSWTVSVSDGIAPAVNATLNITVANVNDAPTWNSDPVDEVNATEDAAYSSTLADDATDIDQGASLVYAKVSGPAWLSVAANGNLSGTPLNADVGANSWTVSVSDGIASAVNATLNITVDALPNNPPAFTSDPIIEASATEDAAYSGTIADDASDPESDPMTFSKVSGPAWLSVAANGDLSGTPGIGDVGLNSFTVQVDATGGSDTATLEITVDSSGPVADFAQSESTLLGSVSSGSISDTYSNDDVYEVLTEAESGGKPSKRHSELEHSWTFNVTGGELVTFYVEAHHDANSEGDDFIFAYSTDNVNFTDMVTVTKTVDDNTAQFYVLPGSTSGTVYIRVVDTDRSQGNNGLDSLYVDALFITSEASGQAPSAATNPDPADAAIDVSVSPVLSWTAGMFASSHDVYFGTSPSPAFQGNQSGTSFSPGTLSESTTYYWAIDEVNAVGTAPGPLWSFTTGVTVNNPPAFTSDPIVEANATEDAAYSATIADDASDPESDPMTFSKVSGPAWLSVASNGDLSGMPTAGDVGLNSFTVQVDATGGSDTATLEITVDAAQSGGFMHVDSITLTAVAAGGPNRNGQAAVVIVDESSQPVQNATVTVSFSGDINEQANGVTDGSGQVVITSAGKSKSPVSLTVTVDNVTHASYTYDPAANVETSESGTYN